MAGGTVYVGSGGIVKNSVGTTTVNLTSGILAAKTDWSTSHNLTLNGATVTVKAADISDVPHNVTFSGALTGSGSLVKTGGGTLTLSSPTGSTYTGSTTISAGAVIASTNAIHGTIVNAGSLTFDQAFSGTYAGAMSGSGSFTKLGAGNLQLSNPQTYTGATTINGGVLRLTGTHATSGLTIGNTAGLALISGNATLNALTLGTGGGDAMSLGVNDGSGLKTINVLNTNGLSTAGTTTVDVGIAGLTLGTHTLVDYSGSIQGSGYGAFALGSLPARVTANLANNVSNTSVDLVVTLIDFPRWEGTNPDGNVNPTFWDVNTTRNWKEATSGTVTKYLESTIPPDQVLFTDAATGTTAVDITQTVTPTFVTVNNNAKNYTFSGSFGISGATGLLKQGTGSLTISNAGNNYTGNTTISGGTVILGADNVLSDNSAVTISGATLDINTRSDTTGPVTLVSGNITGSGGSLSATSYDVQSGTINATLSGAGGLTKSTAGTVVINNTASYSGTTTVAEGTLRLGLSDALPLGNPLVIGSGTTSGTLDLNGFSQTVDRLSSSGTGTANVISNSVGGPAVVLKVTAPLTSANTTYSGAINGNVALLMNSGGSLTLAGTDSTYTGGTTIDNLGTLVISGDGSLGAVPGVSTNNINFIGVSGSILRANAGATTINLAPTRDIFIDAGVTANFDSGGGGNTMTINGVINGAGHVGKMGNGTVILTNSANSYAGSTTIVSGNLRITTPTAISPNPITIGTATNSVASFQLGNGVSVSNGITTNTTASDNMIDSVDAGGMATYAGTVTAGLGNQIRLGATGAGATLIFSGQANLTGPFVPNQGNIRLVGTSSIAGNQGLIARPAGLASLNLTLADNASVNMSQFANLGNARNVSDATVTLQDSATMSVGGTFTLLDTTNATGTSTVNLNGASILTSGNFLKTSVGAPQTSTINFNGGTLKVAGTSNTYMPALTGLTVNANSNAIVDTNGFDAIINQPFTGVGGLVKNGVGNLTMGGASTFTGPTSATAGTLTFANSHTTSSSLSASNDAVIVIAPTGTGTRIIKTGPISLSGTAKINIQDNKLITTTPAGTWNGTNYTGVHGLIKQGRGATNLWDGTTGIITTQTLAVGSNYTSIGVARASDVRPATATATGTWAGQTITGTDTLVMYTYGGDANLDGKLNIDDYVRIDQGIAASLTGWSNGDFNYDGKINIDDYTTVIDSNIGNQNGIFFTAGGVVDGGGLSGVSAVPEPATFSLLGVGAAALIARRRRRR